MTLDQWTVVLIILAALGLFVWGRVRYDIVAMLALLAAVVSGVVPESEAFHGFAHPAVITVIAVLIISQAIQRSNILDPVIRRLGKFTRTPTGHVGVLASLSAALSTAMNNVGALALLLPVAIQTARKAKRPPSMVLMPLSFASLLGGLITMIGTPPNLIIAEYRAAETGEPFRMFDYSPVGLGVAGAGLAFIILLGWRLLPRDRHGSTVAERYRIEDYVVETRVPPESRMVGRMISELHGGMDDALTILRLVRNESTVLAPSAIERIQADDILIVETAPDDLKQLVENGELEVRGGAPLIGRDALQSSRVTLMEVVIPPMSTIEGRTARSLNLHSRFGINLIGLSRRGRGIGMPLAGKRLEAGDVLLVQGDRSTLHDSLRELGCLPLADRGLDEVGGAPRTGPVLIFLAAILIAATGLLPVHIAFMAAVGAIVMTGALTLRQLYNAIDWPIVVLLGGMLPVGQALDATGAATVISSQLVGLSMGAGPVLVLLMMFLMTMLLTDVINNNAAAVVMAPIAIGVAHAMDVNVDAFLMAVAVSASSAYLTPIGHQSNTLIMGPGGYRFGDYWRLGLPLQVIVTATAIPLILLVWPL